MNIYQRDAARLIALAGLLCLVAAAILFAIQ